MIFIINFVHASYYMSDAEKNRTIMQRDITVSLSNFGRRNIPVETTYFGKKTRSELSVTSDEFTCHNVRTVTFENREFISIVRKFRMNNHNQSGEENEMDMAMPGDELINNNRTIRRPTRENGQYFYTLITIIDTPSNQNVDENDIGPGFCTIS